MPHRRKQNRKEFAPQLKFEPDQSFLYLSYLGISDDGDLLVSLETLVILFSIKFCDIKNIKIRLLNDSCRTDSDSVVKISIKRDISLDYKIVETTDVASELQACKLPAWYLPNQRTCIAGLYHIIQHYFSMNHDFQSSLFRVVFCNQIFVKDGIRLRKFAALL